MTTTTQPPPLDQPAAPDAAADLAALLQLLAVLIEKGEPVRDVLDYCRRRTETASGVTNARGSYDGASNGKKPALLTTKEASAYLRISTVTLYSLWHRKAFKLVKVGSATRWPRRELDRYIDRQTKAAR